MQKLFKICYLCDTMASDKDKNKKERTMETSVEHYALSDLVTIKAGYPFRSTISPIEGGAVRVAQSKDISDQGLLITDDMVTTDLPGKRQPDWLKAGDMLFVGKGAKHIACLVSTDMADTTCSPHLFIMRVKPALKDKVNPQFLVFQLNQLRVQNYLKRSAEGAFQINVRRAVLEAVPIKLPDIKTQNTIAKFYVASIKENAALQQLMKNRQAQLSAIELNLSKD